MGKERRQYERYDVVAQIRVRHGRVNYIMDVKNISRSGMFVASAGTHQMPWFRVGQFLEIDLFTTEALDNIRVTGTIVRLVRDGAEENHGFAVKFIELDETATEKIEELIRGATIRPPPLPV